MAPHPFILGLGSDESTNAEFLGEAVIRTSKGTKPRLITPAFLLVGFASLAYFTADGVLLPAIPLYVEEDLGGGSVAVGLVVGAFSVSALLLRPFAGRLSDRRGRRLCIVGGAGLLAASVLGYLVATSIPVLVAMRLLTGVGEAFFFVGAASAVADLSPAERRGEALSFFSLALYAGIGIGPVLGETVLGDDRFYAPWLLAAGFAGLAALLGLRIPETRATSDEGASGRTRLIHPGGLLPGVGILAIVSGMSGFFAFVPLYAPQIGLSGSRFVFLSFSVVVMLVRSFGARIPDILGPARAGRAALAGSVVGLVIMGTWRTPAGLFTGATVFALGVSLAFPALMALAISNAPPSERGAVVGTFTAFVDLGFGVGPVLLGIAAAESGYPGAFLTASVGTALGLLVLLRSRMGRLPATGEPPPPEPTVP